MAELTLHRVSYRYPRAARDALQGVECRFRAGEVAAVVGPSGSGKTTLLSIMAGLDRPSGGEVLVDGKKLSEMDLDAYRRQYVSVIFQAFHLFPLLTVLDNVCFPMELLGAGEKDAREQARRNLELVGIAEEKHRRYPSQLSGGEQQRVAIARALSSGAKILLADEPTGNLDSKTGQNVLGLLKLSVETYHQTLVMITHNLELAQMADRVVRIEDGRICG